MRLMKLSMISSSFVLIAIAIGSIVQLVSVAVVAVEYDKSTCDPGPHNIPNPSIEGDIISVSPDLWYFQIPTTINDDDDNDGNNMIIIEVNRTWAPIGVDRFYSLVKDNYYNCAAFFRVEPGFIIQWGIASSPEETEKWINTIIQDDPVLSPSPISNTVGTVTFATAGPNTRTTQIFVNYVDNSFLDSQTGFVPFGKVVKGMGILTTIGGMYEPSSPVPVDQTTYTMEGNSWILQNYPDIDIIKGISNSEQPPKILLTLNEPSSVPSSAPSSSSDNDNNDDITTTTIGTITTDIIYPNEDPNDRPTPLTSSSAGSAGTTSKKIIIYCSGTVITLIFSSFVVHNVY